MHSTEVMAEENLSLTTSSNNRDQNSEIGTNNNNIINNNNFKPDESNLNNNKKIETSKDIVSGNCLNDTNSLKNIFFQIKIDDNATESVKNLNNDKCLLTNTDNDSLNNSLPTINNNIHNVTFDESKFDKNSTCSNDEVIGDESHTDRTDTIVTERKPLKSILKKSKYSIQQPVAAVRRKFVIEKVDTTVNNDVGITNKSNSINKIQNRLIESQTKIAKLQQSLPTKLNSQTVETLKQKYSPTNFGFPKLFTTKSSKIPVFNASTQIQNNSATKNELENSKNEILDSTADANKPVDSTENELESEKDLLINKIDEIPERDTSSIKKNIIQIESSEIVVKTDSDCESESLDTAKDLKPIDAYAELIKEFTMNSNEKKKKRSNSFRRIFPSLLFGGSSQKTKSKSNEQSNGKGCQNTEQHDVVVNANFDYINNDTSYFDRGNYMRHTFSGQVKTYKSNQSSSNSSSFVDTTYSNHSFQMDSRYTPKELTYSNRNAQCLDNILWPREDDYSVPVDARTSNDDTGECYSKSELTTSTPKPISGEDYVCMDQHSNNSNKTETTYINFNTNSLKFDNLQFNQNKSIDDSNKIDNVLQNLLYEKKDDNEKKDDPQLIETKALIPLNTERPLPNPYRNKSNSTEAAILEPMYINVENNAKVPNQEQCQSKLPTKIITPNNLVNQKVKSSQETKDETDLIDSKRLELKLINTGNQSKIPNKSPYETIYGNIKLSPTKIVKPVEPTPVSAEVKISTTPVITPVTRNQNKLRTRSLSPEQRYKMDLQKSPAKLSPRTDNKIVNSTSVNQIKMKPLKRNESINSKKSLKQIDESSPAKENLEIDVDYPQYNLNAENASKITPEKQMYLTYTGAINSNQHTDGTSTKTDISNCDKFAKNMVQCMQSPQKIENHQKSVEEHQKLPQKQQNLKNVEAFYWAQKEKESNNRQSLPNCTPVCHTVSPNVSPQSRRISLNSTPVNYTIPQQNFSGNPQRSPIKCIPISPQKLQNLQNVEAFYWKKIREMKDKEQMNHMCFVPSKNSQMAATIDYENQRRMRSRSVSPGSDGRNARRSLSLCRGNNSSGMTANYNQLVSAQPNSTYGYITPIRQTNFIRGLPQRNTISSINTQTRVVNRSVPSPQIVNDVIYENYVPGVQLRHQACSVNKTDNPNYAPIFKRGSLQPENSPSLPSKSQQDDRKKVSFVSAGNLTENPVALRNSNIPVWPTKNGFVQSPPTRRNRSESVGSDNVFTPEVPPNNNQQIFFPDQSRAKQVVIRNKVCDIYGQIHDTNNIVRHQVNNFGSVINNNQIYGQIKKTGVIYGELKRGDKDDNRLSNPPLEGYCEMNSESNSPRLVSGVSDLSIVSQSSSQYSQRSLQQHNIPRSDQYFQNQIIQLAHPGNQSMTGQYESESGSEAGEVQRIFQNVQNQQNNIKKQSNVDEEWNADGSKSGRGHSGSDSVGGASDGELRGSSRSGRSARREDPRRHTLSGDQHMYQGGGVGQGGGILRTMDLEGSLPRGYPPPSTMFDDDPGIMSEVETSSTGFRRGGKQRSSLPVVRTPSKTLERPLGLVFLQYRNETKRALLPNEITSIDTVKALFVRSFPKQLTMEYLDSPLVKIYIHDSSKDMFYELEDLRSHLRDIRDRSVLRLFESTDISGGLPVAGQGIAGGIGHFEDQSYFSEPEFDSEYQHQHIHKSKSSVKSAAPPYYIGSASTLPRGGPLLRAYSPAVGAPVPVDRIKSIPGQSDRIRGTDGYMSSPERNTRGQYEDPYYSQFAPRSGSITPVIDEEARIRVEHMERQLANLTGLVQKALTQAPPTPRDFLIPPPGRDNFRPDKSVSFEKSVSFSDEPPDMNSPKQHSPQHTERDRLKPAPPPKPAALAVQYDGSHRHLYRDLQLTPEMYNQLRGLQKKAKDLRAEVRNLRRMSQAQAHSVRETIRDTFIKIRTMLLVGGEQAWQAGMDQEKVRLSREEDLYKQEMIRLEKDLSDLESTVEDLRGNVINRKTRVNMSDVENMALILSKSSKTVADLKVRFPSLQEGLKSMLTNEMEKVVREEKFLKEEPDRLESALRRCKKLTGTLVTLKRLASVQEQRLPCAGGGNAPNDGRLSPSTDETPPVTPTSAQLGKPPTMPTTTRSSMGPSSLGGDSVDSESCQRPENALDALLDELQTFSRPHSSAQMSHNQQQSQPHSIPGSHHVHHPPPVAHHAPSMAEIGRKGSMDSHSLTVSTAVGAPGSGSLRRLHSYPSGSDTDNSPPIQPAPRSINASVKPPLPERNAELLQALAAAGGGRRVPPPPPPRTSSRSPLASPTSPSSSSGIMVTASPRTPSTNLQHIQNVQNMTAGGDVQSQQCGNDGMGTLRRNIPGRSSLKERSQTLPRNIGSTTNVHHQQQMFSGITTATNEQLQVLTASNNSSSCESVNSQDGSKKVGNQQNRQEQLELRHQELLKKQKALQEQYARLQQMQRGNNALTVVPPPTPDLLLKKTGSESNILQKMGLNVMTTTQQMVNTGSLTHLAATAVNNNNPLLANTKNDAAQSQSTSNNTSSSTTSKVYETDIL